LLQPVLGRELSQAILILDGAMGTELERRGYKTRLPLWSAQALLDAPELVLQIHKDYIEAGADIITTNTFRTNPYTVKKSGLKISDARKLTEIACNLAKMARGNSKVAIAGSVAPIEDCFRPDLYPGDQLAEKDHYEHIKNLKQGGVDFILAETMISIKEAQIVLRQAERLNMKAMVSFALNKDGNILNGDNLFEAFDCLKQYRNVLQALLINCTTLNVIRKVIDDLLFRFRRTDWPIGVYPNFGPPRKGKFTEYLTPNKFAQAMLRLKNKGVKILGGCCGTQPAHIAALATALGKRRNLSRTS